MLKKATNFLLACLSGVILGLSWYSASYLIFAGFVPLLIAANNVFLSESKRKGLKILGLSYLTFIIWNLIATWWVYCVDFGKEGAVMAFTANSLLMSSLFLIWYKTEVRLFRQLKFWLLVPFWLAFEFLHHTWELSWPWLTIGNCFSSTINFVQWYEFTGVSGGTLWALSINILLAKLIIGGKREIKPFVKILALIFVPILISYAILSVRDIKPEKEINVTVIQPNIDPYNVKFDESFTSQLNKLHQQLTQSSLNKNTELVVLPETFIVAEEGYDINEADFKSSYELNNLLGLMKIHFPNASILSGASTMHDFGPGEALSSTARKYGNAEKYYDSYNTAVYIDTNKNVTFYHKSKLVPGAEIMPFRWLFKYFEQYALELGGTTGSLGIQNTRTVFKDDVFQTKIAPSICYESIYSDFMAQYVRKGAELICIVTNDGWWGNTPGHKQHLSYAKLRAIETRKQVVRSANTGISCFIDEMGRIQQQQPYWEFAVINQKVELNNIKTFFVRFGDIISYASALLTIIILIYSQYLRFKKQTN